MGEIRNYSCTCGYEKEFNVGTGFMGINKNLIKNTFPIEYPVFDSEYRKGNVGSYLLSNQIVFCENCKELEVVPVFEYEVNGEERKIMGKCSKCNGMQLDLLDAEKIKCPKCHRKMDFENIGHWD